MEEEINLSKSLSFLIIGILYFIKEENAKANLKAEGEEYTAEKLRGF